MLRSAGVALAWLGLSTATMVLSLSACFVDVTEGKNGSCEDDGNPCTKDTCVGGAEQHTPDPGLECSLENNSGKCNEMGRCVLDCETDPSKCRCNVDTQCPPKDDCGEWTCNLASGNCERGPINENLPAPPEKQTKGDCKTVVCKGGEYFDQPEDADIKDSAGDCITYECSNGMSLPKAADVNSACTTGTCTASNVCCSSNNTCVDCVSASDWTKCGGGGCPVKKCNGEDATLDPDPTHCKSGFVADGVCCETACTEVCKSCNVMGGVKGVCSDIPYYQPDPSYVPSGGGSTASCDPVTGGALCNGQGQCLKTIGSPCLTGSQCLSGTCSALMTCLGGTGEVCLAGTECLSGMCMGGKCK